MRPLLLVLAVISVASAGPLSGVLVSSYLNAVDLNVATSPTTFSCLKSNYYTAAFIRCYKSDGDGVYDSNCASNYQNAFKAGINTEIFMEPQPQSQTKKWGYMQTDELHKQLKKNGITVRTVWVKVMNPSTWSEDAIGNSGFINEIITRAREYGYSVGIYTKADDWLEITNNWTQVGPDVQLWYWNVSGNGASGESQPTFTDFAPFSGWTAATVKQFGQNENLCGVTVNRNVYQNAKI